MSSKLKYRLVKGWVPSEERDSVRMKQVAILDELNMKITRLAAANAKFNDMVIEVEMLGCDRLRLSEFKRQRVEFRSELRTYSALRDKIERGLAKGIFYKYVGDDDVEKNKHND